LLFSPALPAIHSWSVFWSAWPGPHHRDKQVGPCCLAAVEVTSYITDPEISQLMSPQDGVVPARLPLAFSNRADKISRPVAKPFNLSGHQMFQNEMRWEQPVELPAANAFD
jgi:hypothetical protein